MVVGRRNARGVEHLQIKWLLYVGPIFFVGSALKIAIFYPFRKWRLVHLWHHLHKILRAAEPQPPEGLTGWYEP